MSEYKCQEPGCNFYIGTGGILVTVLDFKKYYYYSQEVQDHFKMHDEQKREKAARMVAVQFGSQLLERDKVCRVCGGEFSDARKSMAAPSILHLDLDNAGLQYLARVHRVCEIDRALLARHPAVKRILAENYEMSLGGTAPKKTKSHPPQEGRWLKADDQPSAGGDQATSVDDGSTLEEGDSASQVPSVKTDRCAGGNEKGGRVSIDVFEIQSRDTVLLESLNNTLLDIRKFLVRNVDGGPVVSNMSHEVSLSVDGAPDGAGVGASESTERGQTPTSSEKEMPSAVAPAEGGETKIQNGK